MDTNPPTLEKVIFKIAYSQGEDIIKEIHFRHGKGMSLKEVKRICDRAFAELANYELKEYEDA